MHAAVIKLVWGSSIAVTGLMAGLMLGVALEQDTAQELGADCWTVRQNLNDRLFRKIMPPAFLLTVGLSAMAVIVLHDWSRACMIASCVCSGLVVVTTIKLEVPLNGEVAGWKPGHLPENWQGSRDRWLRNHWVRTVFGILAFACSILVFEGVNCHNLSNW